MVTLSSPIGFLEIVVFLAAVAAFGMAVRFFLHSRKSLQQSFPGIFTSHKLLPFGFDRNGFVIPKAPGNSFKTELNGVSLRSRSAAVDSTKEDVKQLRLQLQQQQQELEKALEKISLIGQPAAVPFSNSSTGHLDEQKKPESLRHNDTDVQRLKTQELYTQKLQERLAEVQGAFDDLQEKVGQMEKQAWESAELNFQLEHAEQAQLQAEKALSRKEEKVRELNLENQRLHEAFNELEDKLSEANLQRQQLVKKVQLLESLNADMMQMAEASRKLKSEMARVAELESMLHLMTAGRR
jgi:DNA repair exonuclease SbcCD ATPase subunit